MLCKKHGGAALGRGIMCDGNYLLSLCRQDSMHLLFSSLPQYHGSFRTFPPCIVKPEKLWSGKQIISMLLLNVVPAGKEKLNLVSRAKISVKVKGEVK